MKKLRVAGLVVAGLLMVGSQLAMANDNEREGRGESRSSSMSQGSSRDIAAVDNPLYAKECGSCHFAFQPGFLPERSWRKLMGSLNDHFGENAEVPEGDRQALTDYLVKNASDHSNYKRAVEMDRSIAKGDTPLRISKVPYFVKEHRKVSNRIKGSDKIKSISQCEQCHQKAAEGSYAEREINVPGIGRWED